MLSQRQNPTPIRSLVIIPKKNKNNISKVLKKIKRISVILFIITAKRKDIILTDIPSL